MGKVLFVACTNVGKAMITRIKEDNINVDIVGIVNISPMMGVEKANYQTYCDISIKYNIPIHFCNNINDEETVNWMRAKNPDIIIQTGWSQKFSDEVLGIPTYMCIGEHPAPLPKGRGAACVNWAILTGEKEWGDTFFKMVSKYDQGEILAQESIHIEYYDNVKTVYDKVALVSSEIVIRNIENWVCGKFEFRQQDGSQATYYPKRCPKDGEFNFAEKTAQELYNFIRAQTHPYPGAYFVKDGVKITVWDAGFDAIDCDDEVGTIVDKGTEESIFVVCKDHKLIELKRIQVEEMPEQWACDIFHKHPFVKEVKVL